MKNTYTKIIVACACLLFVFATRAQDRPAHHHGGGGGFTIGYGTMDVSPLHVFVPGSVAAFNQGQLLLGGMGHAFLGNLVIGGSGSAIIGDKIKTATHNYTLGGGMGTFDFGYLAVNRERLKLFPMLGIGAVGYGLQIVENSSVSAAGIRSDPGREVNINQASVVFDVSLNLFVIPVPIYSERERTYGGFMTGLQVGYIYGPPAADWRFAGGNITDAPDFGLDMFYLKLILGGFGY